MDVAPTIVVPVTPAMLTPADRMALTDRQAGRLIDSSVMVQRFGGWPVARCGGTFATLPLCAMPVDPASDHAQGSTVLMWSHMAVRECDRIGRLLAALGGGGERRFAAMLVATMVDVIVLGAGADDAIVDVPLPASFMLRIATANGLMTVLGLREGAAIR